MALFLLQRDRHRTVERGIASSDADAQPGAPAAAFCQLIRRAAKVGEAFPLALGIMIFHL